jgi:rhodanese-related sulfurtransferase
MTAEDLIARMRAGTAPAILDVRSAREFAAGHVPGAVHIPFWRVSARIADIPARPADELVVYWGHGPRARIAGRALRRHGFTRFVYLAGHFSAWRRGGRPEERGAGLQPPGSG